MLADAMQSDDETDKKPVLALPDALGQHNPKDADGQKHKRVFTRKTNAAGLPTECERRADILKKMLSMRAGQADGPFQRGRGTSTGERFQDRQRRGVGSRRYAGPDEKTLIRGS